MLNEQKTQGMVAPNAKSTFTKTISGKIMMRCATLLQAKAFFSMLLYKCVSAPLKIQHLQHSQATYYSKTI